MSKELKKSIESSRTLYFQKRYLGTLSAGEQALVNAADEYIGALERENHSIAVALAEHQIIRFSRIKDLPAEEQREFSKWLQGQTCPYLKGVPYEEQDGYYESDYESFKKSLLGHKVTWD